MSDILAVVETAIYADDLERAEAFYRDVFGLSVLGKEPGRHVFIRVGASSVLLVFNSNATIKGDCLPAHGCRGPGHFAMGIAAGTLDEWRERLQQHGVMIEKEVTWPAGGKSLYVRDPADNAVEVVTPGVWSLPLGW